MVTEQQKVSCVSEFAKTDSEVTAQRASRLKCGIAYNCYGALSDRRYAFSCVGRVWLPFRDVCRAAELGGHMLNIYKYVINAIFLFPLV
jgi:hypothetical protein